MQRADKWPDDYDPEAPRSKPGSRRNSASLSRRSSIKKEKEGKKKSPLNSSAGSSTSTPKKIVKPQNLDFVVTGRQCLKRSDRANSLPGTYRRQSVESIKTKRNVEARKVDSQSSKSRETSLEDDMSLDLSQVSDFEDTKSKYGIKPKFATSTPKSSRSDQPKGFQKPRSSSLQSQAIQLQKAAVSRKNQIMESSRQSRESMFSRSRDSLCKTSTSSQRYGAGITTDLDYSSVSPEYSGMSSADLSPRVSQLNKETDFCASPRSQEMQVSSSFHSCCVSAWQDSEAEEKTRVQGTEDGEWSSFWANYNHSMWEGTGSVGLNFTNDVTHQPPTDNLHSILQNDGLHLTPKETQNIIKCAQILGNVLTKAIERNKDKNTSKEVKEDAEVEVSNLEVDKKKALTLDLKETNIPLDTQEEKGHETVTTQTDISLPNTKTAPRIFEKILKQLSRTSIDDPGVQKNVVSKEEKNGEPHKE